MEQCVLESTCENCSLKLRKIIPNSADVSGVKASQLKLTNFLKQLKINDSLPDSMCPYKEESLSEEIIRHIKSSKSVDDLKDFIYIFSLGKILTENIYTFVTDEVKLSYLENNTNESDTDLDTSRSNSSGSEESVSEISSEYFDDEDELC